MTAPFAAFALYIFGLAYAPLFYAGFAVQSGYLLWRGLMLDRLPLVGVHDTLNFFAASLMGFSIAVHLSLGRRTEKGSPSAQLLWTAAVMAALLTALSLLQKPHSSFLPPVLRTYWFELHVALSFFAYALFAMGAALGAVYLRGGQPDVERLQYKMVFVGYGLFSLAMIFGGVWAYLAWGTYWLWTPKELWTTILWLFYSLYLHARLRRRWLGKVSAALGIAGFFVAMFTYLGVGLLMKSSHAF